MLGLEPEAAYLRRLRSARPGLRTRRAARPPLQPIGGSSRPALPFQCLEDSRIIIVSSCAVMSCFPRAAGATPALDAALALVLMPRSEMVRSSLAALATGAAVTHPRRRAPERSNSASPPQFRRMRWRKPCRGWRMRRGYSLFKYSCTSPGTDPGSRGKCAPTTSTIARYSGNS